MESSGAWIEQLAGESCPADFFARHPHLCKVESAQLLHQEVLRVLYADLSRAARIADASRCLAARLHDPAAEAYAHRAAGHVAYARAQYTAALDAYTAALDIFDRLRNTSESGRTLISGMQPLIYLGRYDDALAWAERARGIFEAFGDHTRLARLASNIGNLFYRQDRYSEALASYERARATLVHSAEPRDLAAVLSNLAVCLVSLGRYAEALAAYTEAREFCASHGLHTLVAVADYNVAYLHYLQGDFLRAMELFRISREHCRTAPDGYHAALCDLDESEICLELNLNREAARLAAAAEDAFQKLGMPYERGKALGNQAVAVTRLGQPRLAARLFQRARHIFAGEKNSVWPALIDLYTAMLLEREGNDRASFRLCVKAGDSLTSGALPGPAVLCDLLQSRLWMKAGRLGEARILVRRAQDRMQATGTPSLRYHTWLLRGQIEEASAQPEAAFEAYGAACAEMEILRSRLWGDEPKISFLKDKLVVYESLIGLCLDHRRSPEEAFAYMQQAKSRGLADLMADPPRPAGTAVPADAELEEVRRSLDTHYRHLERLTLSSRPTLNQFDELKRGIRGQEERLARLLAVPAATLPSAAPLSLAEIQAAIPPGALLVEYYVFQGHICACLLDRESFHIERLGAAAHVRERMRLLRFQLRKFRLAADRRPPAGQGPDAAAGARFRELYDDLIAPLRPRLDAATHLIFAPHDFLHHLPFHALRGPERYVIDDFSVSYAPSATIFALCQRRPVAPSGDSLVLGVPDERAPHIEPEARGAAELLPAARLLLGAEATAQALRCYAPGARYIHIATHGMFRRDNPLFSAIRLGDSHLTLLDLYQLPLTAELVTLSGCSTGLSLVVGGDELIGLMRGLLMAGTRSVMVSLWDVNDRGAALFMRRFYEVLVRESDEAVAIRAAMLALREEYPHPYYWAPFILAGKFTNRKSGKL